MYNYIRKKNEVRRTVNAEKNNMWDNKCTEINMYIRGRRSTETWKFIKAQQQKEEKQCCQLR